ncbi:DUF6318 family protein [Rothia nasisuis]|uniref:DUF6318 family protein n=1 Tax=Rothia nasisuis TaxID=2109647 RepID=UPI001F19C8E0|nr:DUF6318 family protein [Rothia nasisuis]
MKHTQHTALATLTLALLTLTSCANPDTNNIPAPDTSTTASSGHIPTPDPTTSSETNYSGGSKAPAGEYRPADEHGPAQNVPRPTRPEGMNLETPEAMEKFINYWNDMRNYANQTGDVTGVQALIDESFEQEQDFYEALKEIYNSDGWIVGGQVEIIYDKNSLTSLGDGNYSIGSNINVQDSVLWYNGEATYSDNSQSALTGTELQLKYTDGAWKIIGAKKVGN